MTAEDGPDAVGAPSCPDPTEFIRTNMRIVPVPLLPEIQLYMAQPETGLRRLIEWADDDASDDGPSHPPYWAYVWAGGAVLARYIFDHPASVAGRRVLDLGAGSGIVGIAAAKAGAHSVIAAEIDRNGVAALNLNAAANGVTMTVIARDLTGGPPPAVDVVTVGDVFYGQDVADRVIPFLECCLDAGMEVLVGDPGRAHLPRSRLRLLAEYKVPDFGQTKDAALKPSGVFRFEPDLTPARAVEIRPSP